MTRQLELRGLLKDTEDLVRRTDASDRAAVQAIQAHGVEIWYAAGRAEEKVAQHYFLASEVAFRFVLECRTVDDGWDYCVANLHLGNARAKLAKIARDVALYRDALRLFEEGIRVARSLGDATEALRTLCNSAAGAHVEIGSLEGDVEQIDVGAGMFEALKAESDDLTDVARYEVNLATSRLRAAVIDRSPERLLQAYSSAAKAWQDASVVIPDQVEGVLDVGLHAMAMIGEAGLLTEFRFVEVEMRHPGFLNAITARLDRMSAERQDAE